MTKLLSLFLPSVTASLKSWLSYGAVVALLLGLGFAGVKLSSYLNQHQWIAKAEVTSLKEDKARLEQAEVELKKENAALSQSVQTLNSNVKVLQDTVNQAEQRMQRQLEVIERVEKTAKAMQVKMNRMQAEATQQIQELRARPELGEDQLLQLERRVRYQLLADLAECANSPHAASCLETLK